MFVELEHWVEEIYAGKQKKEGTMQFYKGTVKKWQVLDDEFFDREQVEKM